MKIEKIEVFVIGPEDTHYTWSEDIPEIYQSNTIIRVYTDNNIIGEAPIHSRKEIQNILAQSYQHKCDLLLNEKIEILESTFLSFDWKRSFR